MDRAADDNRVEPSNVELWKLDASQQVSLVASGKVSCRELVEAHLTRLNSLNPRLGAVTVTLEESALRNAEELDRLGAEQDEGVDGRAPETVPSGLAASGVEADDALPARVLEPGAPVLTPAGPRGIAPNLACVMHAASADLTNPLPRACKKPCRTGIASLT